MTFDEAVRRRAEREDCPVPAEFEEVLKEAVTRATGRGRRRRRPTRVLLLAAAVTAALTATAVAASPGLREALAAALGSYEPYSYEVEGASATDRGIAVRAVSALSDGNLARVYYEIQDMDGDRLGEELEMEWEIVDPENGAEWEQWSYAGGRPLRYDPDSRTALMELRLFGAGLPVDSTLLRLERGCLYLGEERLEGGWALDVPLTTAPSREMDMGRAPIGQAEAETLRITALGAHLETAPTIALRSRRDHIRRWPLTVYLADGTTVAAGEADSVYPGYEYESYHWTFPDPVDPEQVVGVEIDGQYFDFGND